MRHSERSFNHHEQSDLSSGPSRFSQEQALTDIHAAMMEELGIGRKDTLPLEDKSDNFRKDISTYSATLRPRKVLPGAATWKDAIFDDVDPAEAAIDSIADGQLARIRRQRNSISYDDKSNGRRYRANKTESYGNSFKDESFTISDRTHGERNKIRGGPLNINIASAENFRNFNTRNDRLRSPHVYSNDARNHPKRHSRVDLTIARIRAAFQQPSHSSLNSSRSYGSVNRSQGSRYAAGEENFMISRTGVRQNSFTSQIENISPSIDESYTTPTSQLNEKLVHEASNVASGTDKNVKKEAQTMPKITESDPGSCSKIVLASVEKSKSPSVSGSIRSQPQSPTSALSTISSQKASELRSSTLALKRLGGLQDSRWSQDPTSDLTSDAQMSGLSGKLGVNQYVIRELPVKFQKNKEIRQLGIARLVRERGTENVEIHLEQNNQIFLREVISENSIFASDWKNPDFVIVFKAVQKVEAFPTWRIYFKVPYMKDEFEKAVTDLRKREFSVNTYHTDITSPVSTRNISSRQSSSFMEYSNSPASLLDNLENKTSSNYDLIHIDPSSQAYLTSPASNNRINTDTLNEMSEIGGITPLINFSEAANNEPNRPHIGSFTQDLIDINDDLLIEGLIEKLLEKRGGTVLDLLSELVVGQGGTSASSMTSEEIRSSSIYAQELSKVVREVLNQSEVFTQLPSAIGDSYMKDKALKILEKSLSHRGGMHTQPKSQQFEESRNLQETSADIPIETTLENDCNHPHSLQEWSQQSDFYKVPSTTLFNMSNSVEFRISTSKIHKSKSENKTDSATTIESPQNEFNTPTSFTEDSFEYNHSNLSRIVYRKEELLDLRSQASPFEDKRLDDEVALYIGPKRVLQAGRPVKPKCDIKFHHNNDRRTMQHQSYHAHQFNRQKWENYHQEKAHVFDVSSGDYFPISPPPQELTMELKSSTTNSELDSLIKNLEGMKLDNESPANGEVEQEFLPTPPATAKFPPSENESRNRSQNINSFENINSESPSYSYSPWDDRPEFLNKSNPSSIYEKPIKNEISKSAIISPKIAKIAGAGTQKGLKSSIWCCGASDTVSGYN
ncbi:hypothetical protein K3495_g10862 [Podosphaera aphanis]|nr:hypothetical protein K3495_g10862 [Podosphaera aphanis]